MAIALTRAKLRSVQLIQLELLAEVDRICRKCDIHYNIIAGTLLGAVRHGGYIPWDDDADVAFLRPEYEKFRRACKTELDRERFYFQDNRNTRGYRWGFLSISFRWIRFRTFTRRVRGTIFIASASASFYGRRQVKKRRKARFCAVCTGFWPGFL